MVAGADDDDRVPVALLRELCDDPGLAPGRVGGGDGAENLHVHELRARPSLGAERDALVVTPGRVLGDDEHGSDAVADEVEPDVEARVSAGEDDHGIGPGDRVVVACEEERTADRVRGDEDEQGERHETPHET